MQDGYLLATYGLEDLELLFIHTLNSFVMPETIINGKKISDLKINPRVKSLLQDLYIEHQINPDENLIIFNFKEFDFSIKRANGIDYFITKMLRKAYKDGYKAGCKSLGKSIVYVINDMNNSK